MPVEPELKLNKPWLIAVWPGMGQVAMTAGYYLMAKLGMHAIAEFSPRDLFDAEHIEVSGGLIRLGRMPRSRFFVASDLDGRKHDIVLFIGEAQPPQGKYVFCQRLIEYAKGLGIERVFTFASMATQMHPTHRSRVFGAATDPESLAEFKRLEVELLEGGHISGLNGLLLGVSAEMGVRGACLLGEIPHIFAQLPFPKAALAVLEVFTTLAGIEIDLSELGEQASAVDRQLGELLAQLEAAIERQAPVGEEAPEDFQPADEERLSPADSEHIEQLFEQAQQDRSTAYELKRELDRLKVFADYEDRFLDLFKKPE
jgi:proteasome assembly chaperone (PAC2) family protein